MGNWHISSFGKLPKTSCMLTARARACCSLASIKKCSRTVSTVRIKSEGVEIPKPASDDPHRNYKITQIEQLFEKLSNQVVLGKSSKDHQRSFETKEQEEQTMKSIVSPYLSGAKFPSQEQQKFFAQEADTDEFGPTLSDLHAGDFLEIRRNNIVTHGIVIDFVVSSEAKPKVLTLTSTGEIWPHLPMDVQFTIPNFLDLSSVVACGNKFYVERPAHREARLSAVKRIRAFERDVEMRFRGMGRRLSRLYPLLASSDQNAWNKVTTKQALSILDSQTSPSVAHIFAMHKHLMSRCNYFVCDESMHFRTHSFYVRPKRDAENMERVIKWVINRSHQLTTFIEKASKIVASNRELRREREDQPLRVEVNNSINFSHSDLEIIHFLKCSVRKRRSIQTDPYTSYARSVINEVQMYPSPVTTEITHKFLQEIGVYAPWDDPIINDSGNTQNMQTLEEARTMEENVPSLPKSISLQPISSLGNSVSPDLPPSLGELYKYDTAEAQRHDFGDLPVFVVDDPGAEELDDGVSVELVHGHPDVAWVHVHVADPTLLLPPDHVISRQAEVNFTTLYLLQETRRMLPEDFIKLIHLGSAGEKKSVMRTMTFSALIDSTGTVQDIKVRPGIVRNVRVMSYEEVNTIMGWDTVSYLRPFEQSEPPATPSPDLYKWKDTFKTLNDTLLCIVRKRNLEGFLNPCIPTALIKALDRPLPRATDSKQSHTYYGKPKIEFIVNRGANHGGARDMVAECMKLAGRVASLWFIQHKIPGIRRTLGPYEAPGPNSSALEKLQQLQRDNGFVDIIEIQRAGVLQPTSFNSLEPKGHSVLGIPDGEGYLRVTSPLRRFTDLVHHWQIKHILAGGSLNTIPYSRESLAEHLLGWNLKERMCSRLDQRQMSYWAAKYIAERFNLPPDDPRAVPIQTLTGRIFGEARWDPILRFFNTPVLIDSLGLKTQIVSTTPAYPDIGVSFPVKIKEVELDSLPTIKVVPV